MPGRCRTWDVTGRVELESFISFKCNVRIQTPTNAFSCFQKIRTLRPKHSQNELHNSKVQAVGIDSHRSVSAPRRNGGYAESSHRQGIPRYQLLSLRRTSVNL